MFGGISHEPHCWTLALGRGWRHLRAASQQQVDVTVVSSSGMTNADCEHEMRLTDSKLSCSAFEANGSLLPHFPPKLFAHSQITHSGLTPIHSIAQQHWSELP